MAERLAVKRCRPAASQQLPNAGHNLLASLLAALFRNQHFKLLQRERALGFQLLPRGFQQRGEPGVVLFLLLLALFALFVAFFADGCGWGLPSLCRLLVLLLWRLFLRRRIRTWEICVRMCSAACPDSHCSHRALPTVA